MQVGKVKRKLPVSSPSTDECRYTARLLILALDEDDKPQDELLSRLCAILKTGKEQATPSVDSPD